MKAVKSLLRIGGLFAFSVEAIAEISGGGPSNQREYLHTTSECYAHARDYIEKLPAINNFNVSKMKLATTRIERGVNIKAWHAIWVSL